MRGHIAILYLGGSGGFQLVEQTPRHVGSTGVVGWEPFKNIEPRLADNYSGKIERWKKREMIDER